LAKLKQAEETYERAIALDPNFALAFARYSQLESWIVHSFGRSPERREKSRSLAVRAAQLQPQLPEAHLALGFVYYYIDNNFDAAASEFEIAQRGLPNESEVYLALGAIQRRQGKWNESNMSLEKAVSLNPKDTWPMQNLAINYEMQRNWDAANKILERGLAITPNAFGLIEIKCKVAIQERGDFSLAQQFLNNLDASRLTPEIQAQLAAGRAQMFILLRQYSEAVGVADKFPDSMLTTSPGALCGKYTAIGVAKKAIGDAAGARDVFEKAKRYAEEDIKQTPDDAPAHARLGEALAWLGQKEAALAEIKRAQELLPESKDSFDGPAITKTAAEIHAIFGDAANAVAVLDRLLQRPGSVTVATLKLDPIWDPIRNDPAFKALIDKYGAKA
jgi:serine/threonine-protein kinase